MPRCYWRATKFDYIVLGPDSSHLPSDNVVAGAEVAGANRGDRAATGRVQVRRSGAGRSSSCCGRWRAPRNCDAAAVPRVTSPGSWTLALGCLLAVATLALYHPVNHYPFANADDDSYIGDNIHVKYGFEPDTVKWAFTTFRDANWHPVTWLSHALDCHLYSLDAGKHHRTNVAAACRQRCPAVLGSAAGHGLRRPQCNGGRPVRSASHQCGIRGLDFRTQEPAEHVVLSARLGRLSMVCVGAPIGRYTRGCASVRHGADVQAAGDYLPVRSPAVGLLAVAANVCRRPGIHRHSIPARSFSWLVVEKLPLFVLSAASAVITIKAQGTGGAMSGPLNTYPFLLRLENAIVSYVRYIGKAIWPSRLAFMYPHSSFAVWQVAAAFLLLAVITGMVIAGPPSPVLMVGWFWFLGTLVPMIGLVQVGAQAMADRYAYLPFVGLFIMICWGVSDWCQEAESFHSMAGRCPSLAAYWSHWRWSRIARSPTGATMSRCGHTPCRSRAATG